MVPVSSSNIKARNFLYHSRCAIGFIDVEKAGDVLQMALYVGVSVVIGILAVWGGMALLNISSEVHIK